MRVVFLDRDGVINKYPGDFKYVARWDEFHFLPKAKPALKNLNHSGFKIFVISNQAGVSKGLYSKKTLDLITKNMLGRLKNYGVNISGVYYCTHLKEENCACRKPKTGLIKLALGKLKSKGIKIEHRRSYFIGDSIVDIETGKAAGLRTILVLSGKEKLKSKSNWSSFPDYTAKDLSEAVELVLKK